MFGFGATASYQQGARLVNRFLGGKTQRSRLPAALKPKTVGPKPNEEASSLFLRRVNVKHFQPSEVTVTVIGYQVVVKGSHPEIPDGHGFVSRSFTHTIELPGDVNPDEVAYERAEDDYLIITAPRRKTEGERAVPAVSDDKPQVRRVVKQSNPQSPSFVGTMWVTSV